MSRLINSEANGNNTYVITLNRYNARCTKLNSSQHTALSMITSMRHQLHCMTGWMLKLPKSDVQHVVGFFDELLPILLRGTSLPPLEIHIDEVKRTLTGTEESATDRAIDLVNREVEAYLGKIDAAYGTEYCPTGIKRHKRFEKMRAGEMVEASKYDCNVQFA